VISRPVVYTVNNKKALISSGTDQPVAPSTLSSLNQTDSAVDTSTALQSNIDFRPVVLQLEVVPLINSDKEVTLTIAQKNDNVQGTQTIAGNEVPVISTQQLKTTVTVPNRHTVVLGGLITNEETRAATGIPFLKDIPGLGYLFSSTKKDHIRRELIVLIQPFIINSRENLQEANYIERSNVSFREGLFDKPVDIRPAELPPPENVRIGN
jgi:type II secretory pathway component GspD/PulD (secretin)